jgi:hypothetical protein
VLTGLLMVIGPSARAMPVAMTPDTNVAPHPYAPPGGAEITNVLVSKLRHIVIFRFRATGRTRGFECSLTPTRKPPRFARCRPPKSYDKLRPGTYEFIVRALVRGGAERTPARRKLKVPIEFSRCWGAASRDPEHRCSNPALDDVVVPTPYNALLIPGGDCRKYHTNGQVDTCSFGDAANARGTVAVIGDSHAAALEPAMHYVALANQWQGLGLIHNGCAFSEAPMLVSSSYARTCLSWRQRVTRWLVQHPEVTTVVISGSAVRQFASSAVAGFHRAWAALPPSVRHIFVIRDVPHGLLGESDCVQRGAARHEAAGRLCAEPRSATLADDAEARAASDSRSSRVRLLDLTPFFCDSRRCFPVVGGALVLKDIQHLTHEFAITLGPYLVRSINAAEGSTVRPSGLIGAR